MTLSEIVGLFMQGFTVGGLLSAIAFILGYAINAVIQMMKKG